MERYLDGLIIADQGTDAALVPDVNFLVPSLPSFILVHGYSSRLSMYSEGGIA
jgi:hypothetical protein